MSLLDKVIALSKVAFDYTRLEQLYREHTNPEIVQLIISQRGTPVYPIVLDFVDHLVQGPLYSAFLMQNDDTLHHFLHDPDVRVRAMISECIERHDYEFAGAIAQLFSVGNATILLLIVEVMVKQLCDPDSEVGLKAFRTIRKIFSPLTVQTYPQLLAVLVQEFFKGLMATGIALKDSVVQLRFMELIIGFANLDRSVFEAYLQYGIMKQVTIIYNTDDLLVKLNVIEIVQYMGDTQWCAEFLLQQQFFKELISGATNENEEFYVRKYQVLLLCKLIGNRVVKLTPQYETMLRKLLHEWFKAGTEYIEAALEMIGQLGSIREGLDLMNEQLIYAYMSNAGTQHQVVKHKFYSSLQGLLRIDNTSPKQPDKIYQIYNLLGTPGMAYDTVSLQKSSQAILKQLEIPIDENEIIMLQLFKVIIGWREILRSFVTNEALLQYLVRYSPSKEVYDLKRSAIKDLLFVCEPEFKEFANKLREQLQHKQTSMMVETEVK